VSPYKGILALNVLAALLVLSVRPLISAADSSNCPSDNRTLDSHELADLPSGTKIQINLTAAKTSIESSTGGLSHGKMYTAYFPVFSFSQPIGDDLFECSIEGQAASVSSDSATDVAPNIVVPGQNLTTSTAFPDKYNGYSPIYYWVDYDLVVNLDGKSTRLDGKKYSVIKMECTTKGNPSIANLRTLIESTGGCMEVPADSKITIK
jgi:hypothetical protein